MRSGPELDVEVAKKVWRYLVVIDSGSGHYNIVSAFGSETLPPYSTDPAASALIEQFLAGQGWKLRTRRDGTGYAAAFIKPGKTTYRYFVSETLPTAICHAALAVVNGTNIQSK